MGFPAGMPLKYAPNATVRDASNEASFVANLDTFGGNSGSGVYDQTSKKLIGILVEGEIDYKPDTSGTCNLINVCPDNGCTGETVAGSARCAFRKLKTRIPETPKALSGMPVCEAVKPMRYNAGRQAAARYSSGPKTSTPHGQ